MNLVSLNDALMLCHTYRGEGQNRTISEVRRLYRHRVGGTASALKVQEVCRGGETEACKKARFTETASFFGGIGLGELGTAATTASAPYLCGAIGFASAGAGGFVCSLVLIGIGSYISGKGGEWGGEMAGEEIYRVLQ